MKADEKGDLWIVHKSCGITEERTNGTIFVDDKAVAYYVSLSGNHFNAAKYEVKRIKDHVRHDCWIGMKRGAGCFCGKHKKRAKKV